MDSLIEFVALIIALDYIHDMSMNMNFKRFALILLAAGLSSLIACSGKQVDENDPAALFKEAEEEVANDHYQLAIDHFRAIKNKFPYSKYAIEAQLRVADVYFLQESFTEAAAAYETFRDLHPKHEKTAYAMFRIGKSYFNDIPGVHARDLTPADRCARAYEDFLRRYPQAPEASEARSDLKEALKTLAEKELYVADFYNKRGERAAARARYQKLLERFPDAPFADDARKKLAKLGEENVKSPADKPTSSAEQSNDGAGK